jgi:hypothetical protein
MKYLVVAFVLAGCGSSGPATDQKGKLLFRIEGKQSVVDGEYGIKKEMSDPRLAGRKDADGTRHAVVTKVHLVTKKFSADGRDVTADLDFDMGKPSGKLTVGGKPCEIFRLWWGTGSVDDVKYEGFTGICKLGDSDQDFTLGIVAQ